MTVGRYVAVTDAGRKRRRNEDSYVVSPPLFAVADGMGGAQAGEIASRLAAAALTDDPSGPATGEEAVAALIQAANRRVYERSSEDAAVSGMGTTMTAALVEDGFVTFGHVGDSRAYLLRGGELRQLTEDHSLVGELIRSGKLSPEEADHHPQRAVITRALGTDPDVDVDTFRVEARPGDLFLICSDGLTTMVGDATILGTVEEHRGDLEAAARALVRSANRGGGEDNITVVCFEIVEAGDETEAIPSAPPSSDGFEDEDTLSGIEAIPPVAAEPEPAARRSPRSTRLLAMLGVAVLLIALAALVIWGLAR